MHPTGLALPVASNYNLQSSIYSHIDVLQNYVLEEGQTCLPKQPPECLTSSSLQDELAFTTPGARSDVDHCQPRRVHWRLLLTYLQLIIIMILLVSTALLLSQTVAMQERLGQLEDRLNASLTSRRKNVSTRKVEREHFEVILQAMRQGPAWQISAFRRVCQNLLRDCVDLKFLRKGSDLQYLP